MAMKSLTEIMNGGRKQIRRLELNEETGDVTWAIDRVMGVFGNPFQSIKLQDARVRCNSQVLLFWTT